MVGKLPTSKMQRLVCHVSMLVCVVILVSPLVAQPPLPSETAPPSNEPAGLVDPGPQMETLTEPVVQRIAVQSGFSAYVPRRWGIISCEVWNPTAKSHEMIIRANWETEDLAKNAIQFTRKFSIPPKTVRVVSYPIRIPDHTPSQKRFKYSVLFLNSRIWRLENGQEIPVLSPLKTPLDKAQISTDFNQPALGYMGPDATELLDLQKRLTNEGIDVESIDSITLRMLRAIKKDQQTGASVFIPQGVGTLATPIALDSLDQLVIADPQVKHHVAMLGTIRNWVANGGRLWVMLDATGVEFAQRLLGDSIELTDLGTEQLTSVNLQSVHTSEPLVAFEYDEPVTNAIVYAENVEVYYELNGAPAAFWKKYGNGEILFTTLESRGLAHPKPFSTSYELLPLVPLQELSLRFFSQTEKAMTDVAVTDLALSEMTAETDDESADAQDKRLAMQTHLGTSRVEEMSDYLFSKVGFEIVAREHIAIVFGVFFLLLCGFGYNMHQKGRLERMLIAGPILVLVTCVYLYFVGSSKRNTLENLVASVQFVNVDNDSRELAVRGFGAVYSEETLEGDIQVSDGTIFWPDVQELTGQNIQMVWDDLESWHWEKLKIPGGTVRPFPFEKLVASEEVIFTAAEFSETGLQGQYQFGPLANLKNGLLVNPAGERVPVQFVDGKLIIGTEELADSQFDTTTSIVDEETGSRINFINALLKRENANVLKFPNVPSIFVWSDPLDLGIDFPGEQKVIGSALTVIPLKITKTAPGEKFMIPSILTSFYPSNQITGTGGSTTYDFKKEQWSDEKMNSSHQMWLKVNVPPEVMPATITKATVTVDLQAGERIVNSVGRVLNEEGLYDAEIIDTRKSPNGQEVFVFDNPTHLKVDEDGQIFLGINVGLEPIPGESFEANRDRESRYTWQINDVDVALEGEVKLSP